MADLREPGRGEDATAADVELDGHDLPPRLRDHRVALEGTGAALPREVNGGARERAADPRLRKPSRVTKQVTAQMLWSSLFSALPSQGTRMFSSRRA